MCPPFRPGSHHRPIYSLGLGLGLELGLGLGTLSSPIFKWAVVRMDPMNVPDEF